MLPGIPLVTVGHRHRRDHLRAAVSGALTLAVGATVVGLRVAWLLVLRTVRRATPDRLREAP